MQPEDRALAAQEAQPSPLASLRHDLRTPINAIIGYSEMLLEDLEGETQEHVGQVHALGNDLLQTINTLLGPSAADPDIQALTLELQRELAAPLAALLAKCDDLVAETRALDDEGLAADLEKIRRAATRLEHLISQAASPSPEAENESTPPTGTTGKMEKVLSTMQHLGDRYHAPHLSGKILIVDDNEMNRDVLARYLERHGHSSLAAESGLDALGMIATGSFDLVLLDIMMPGLNGFEVLLRLKGDPKLRDVPIIMISAIDEVESVVRCIEMGAEDYLPKPFDPVLLGARIGACLEKKRLRDQEVAYLRSVEQVISAASAVEADTFDPAILVGVAERGDALGQLARVFTRMAHEVIVREQRLKQQLQQLRIEVDSAKMAHQVAEITESDFFQNLRKKAETIRARQDKNQDKQS